MLNNKINIIGMCHLLEMPGDPNFNSNIGLEKTINRAKKDIEILQQNGISQILLSNEFSYPYTNRLDAVTVLSMAHIIGVLKSELSVPFGVDCMYDSYATIDLANATNADFYRITLPNSTSSDYLLRTTDIGNIIRYSKNYKYSTNAKILLNIAEPLTYAINNKNYDLLLDNIVTQINPYAICISADNYFYLQKEFIIQSIQKKFNKTLFYCDGGCDENNILSVISHLDGVIIGKALKEEKILNNPVDENNVHKIINRILE